MEDEFYAQNLEAETFNIHSDKALERLLQTPVRNQYVANSEKENLLQGIKKFSRRY